MSEVTITVTLPTGKAAELLNFLQGGQVTVTAEVGKLAVEAQTASVEEPELTRGQKAAQTRAANKAKKEAEAAAKEQAAAVTEIQNKQQEAGQPDNGVEASADLAALGLTGDTPAAAEPPLPEPEFKKQLVGWLQNEKGITGKELEKICVEQFGVPKPVNIPEDKRRALLDVIAKFAAAKN